MKKLSIILVTTLVSLSILAQQTLPVRDGAAKVPGNLIVDTNLTVGGTIAVTGATSLKGALTVPSIVATNTASTGTLTVNTNATVAGTLGVTGISTLTGGAIVGGGATILKILSAAASLDFGSIATNASADLTITVAGAGTNSVVILGAPPAIEATIILNAFVNATNTVTVRAFNNSIGAVNPASGAFRATVVQY